MKKFFKMSVVLITVTLIALFAASCSGKNKLKSAYDEVIATYGISSCITIAGDLSYISLDTNPYDIDDYFNVNYMDYIKLLNSKLGLTDYIYQEMIKTTAIQGKQSETINGIKVTWSYHPNNGLEILYVIA